MEKQIIDLLIQAHKDAKEEAQEYSKQAEAKRRDGDDEKADQCMYWRREANRLASELDDIINKSIRLIYDAQA